MLVWCGGGSEKEVGQVAASSFKQKHACMAWLGQAAAACRFHYLGKCLSCLDLPHAMAPSSPSLKASGHLRHYYSPPQAWGVIETASISREAF